MKILFVCSGNTCRSAMCEAYFNALCRENGTESLRAESAGTGAWEGERASESAVQTLRDLNADIVSHRARRLTARMTQDADLIVVMTAAHRSRVLMLDPSAAEKTHLLGEYSGAAPHDIADPFGGGLDVYSLCFADMKEPLDRLFEELNSAVKQHSSKSQK